MDRNGAQSEPVTVLVSGMGEDQVGAEELAYDCFGPLAKGISFRNPGVVGKSKLDSFLDVLVSAIPQQTLGLMLPETRRNMMDKLIKAGE